MAKKFVFLYAADILQAALPDTTSNDDLDKSDINKFINDFEFNLMGL